MRGWFHYPVEHSLAARGIRTRAIQVPSDYPIIDETINKMIKMDRWDLSIERKDTKYETVYVINIKPRMISGTRWVKGGVSSKDIAVDFNLAHLETDKDGYTYPVLKPDSGYSMDVPATSDGNLYRGMSWEEFQFIRKHGYVHSDCSYNIGTAEEGCTFFSENPDTAKIYAGNFQPFHMVPSFDRPGYIIKIKHPSKEHIKAEVSYSPDNIGVVGHIPISDVVEVYEARPYAVTPGYVEIYQKYIHQLKGTFYQEGSRLNPKAWIGYKKLEGAL